MPRAWTEDHITFNRNRDESEFYQLMMVCPLKYQSRNELTIRYKAEAARAAGMATEVILS